MSDSNLNLIQGSGLIDGTDLGDCIIGSREIDVIDAGRGNDNVSGDDGDDTIDGQQGNDILSGDGGSDTLAGGNGSDVLIGGEGNDWLVGGNRAGIHTDDDYLVGTDYAAGGIGEVDILRGSRGADTFVLAETKATLEQDIVRQDELIGQVAEQKLYYQDPGFSNGNNSYALIEDFRPNQGDKIQLLDPDVITGQSSRLGLKQFYMVGPSPIPDVQGNAIYLSSTHDVLPADLIAIVRFPANPGRQVNLMADYVSYVGEQQLPQPIPFPVEPPIDLPAQL
ncbi:MAG: calcium-binding protein [Cyanobacteria bacterium P01_A01_bin.37]